MLFPTHFYTEGIPGTIIDAYASGVPVISAKWESFEDLVNDKVGYGYSFGNNSELVKILQNAVIDSKKIGMMKKNFLKWFMENCLRRKKKALHYAMKKKQI